jgi:hypothetical protein
VVEWQRPAAPNSNIDHVIILRQSNLIAGQYDSIGEAGNLVTDTAFADMTSQPWIQPYFYKIQARANCPSGGNYLTGPSSYHKTIHLQISKAPTGNVFNLLWTGYEGYNVTSYKIYRGLSPSSTAFLTSVAGNITAYTDVPPTSSVYFYRIEAETQDAYFAWGRINAMPRTSKSNIRPNTQSLIDSTSIFNVTTTVEIPFQTTQFRVYPNPHSQSFFLEGGLPGKEYKAILRDVMGRELGSWSIPGNSPIEIRTQAPKGMYWMEIKGEGYSSGKRLLRE